MAKEKMYEWLDEDERRKFNSLEDYLRSCIASSLNAFCSRHFWLVQLPTSSDEGSFYGDLFGLGLLNVQSCLGKKSGEDLAPIYKYGEHFIFLQDRGLEKITKEQELNLEQEKKMVALAHRRALFLHNRLKDRGKIRGALYRSGRDHTAFWMEEGLNTFIKVMKEGREQYIKSGALFDKIPQEFMKGDGAKKYAGREGEKRFKRDITSEVFAAFEKDLRKVQWNVLEHLERSRPWWQKKWVKILAAIVSSIALYQWLIQLEWSKWL